MTSSPPEGSSQQTISDTEKFIFGMLESKRSTRETLLWQVPALTFTAQAFLFTISLGNSSRVARLIASVLSMIVAILSLHLLMRHRAMEVADSKKLETFEEKKSPHSSDKIDMVIHRRPQLDHPVIDWFMSSYHVWVIGLLLMTAASVLVFFLALFNPALLTT